MLSHIREIWSIKKKKFITYLRSRPVNPNKVFSLSTRISPAQLYQLSEWPDSLNKLTTKFPCLSNILFILLN